MKTLLQKYPLAANELLHFPMMYPDSLKKFHVPGIPYATLDFLYTFGDNFGVSRGTVRTTLSRMKKEGIVFSEISGKTTRYRVSPMQLEVMTNFQKRKKIQTRGYSIAVFSFEKSQEKERIQTRSLLQYYGFVRFAQNAYINIAIDEKQLRNSLKEYQIADNVFLFRVKTIDKEDLSRISNSWKIPERIRFLDSFFTDIRTFINENDGSDCDIFFRIAIVWVLYITHVHSSEPPLPEELFPDSYAYPGITAYLNRISMKYGKQMIRFWKESNAGY